MLPRPPFFIALCLLGLFSLGSTAPPAAADDLDDVRARGELRHLAIPYANFVDGADGGFDVDIVKDFAAGLGVRYVQVPSDFYSVARDLLGQDVVRDGDDARLTGAYPQRGDVIASGFTILPWRAKIMLFSDPTFPSQVWLVARADSAHRPIKGGAALADDIAETKAMIGTASLLVMEKTCLDPANYGLTGRGLDLRAYTRSANPNEMTPALLNGEAELTLLDVPDALLDLKKWAGRIKVLGPVSEEQELGAAFRPSGPALRDAFNAHLSRMRADGRYDALVDKYYPAIRGVLPAFFQKRPSGPQ